MNDSSVSRRRLLSGVAISGAVAVAGCLGGNGDDDDENGEDGPDHLGEDLPAFPEVEDPPAAVYRPTHREEMVMGEVVTAGEYAFAPMYTYPHPFWRVDGTLVERHDPTAEEDIHLMVSIWDEETGTVVPVDAVDFDIYKDGDRIDSVNPWTMISQEMGFHVGDNVSLDGDGTYRVQGTVPPITLERTGEFEGRFDDRVEFEFDVEFSLEKLGDLLDEIEYFPEEEWGERGALEPMDHGHHDDGHHDDGHHHDHEDNDDHDDGHHHGDDDGHHDDHVPYSSLPSAEDLPGTLQGIDADGNLPESGDADFVISLLESDSRFVEEGAYLLVSPRTPYNHCVLPQANLEVTLERDGETVLENEPLQETIDPDVGHHYGLTLEDVEDGDEVTLEVTAPPQVDRHQGYETAFLEMEPISLEISL